MMVMVMMIQYLFLRDLEKPQNLFPSLSKKEDENETTLNKRLGQQKLQEMIPLLLSITIPPPLMLYLKIPNLFLFRHKIMIYKI